MDRAKKQKGKIESLKEQGEGGDGREGGERETEVPEKEQRAQQ